MKIVVFGLTISSSWGNGHATLWRGLARALIRRGHRFVFSRKTSRGAPEPALGGEPVLAPAFLII